MSNKSHIFGYLLGLLIFVIGIPALMWLVSGRPWPYAPDSALLSIVSLILAVCGLTLSIYSIVYMRIVGKGNTSGPGFRTRVTCQCGERRKLGCTVPHRHLRMTLRYVMRQINNIVVVIHYALCPPICLLRSMAVAPSSKFRPLRMAFLPKRCLIFNCASCIRRSLSSFAFSSCFCFSNAS